MNDKQLNSAEQAALAGLMAKHGKLTADLVLQAASSSSSPLHGRFEWDNTEAARQFRLHQAGALVVRARVTMVPPKQSQVSARARVEVQPPVRKPLAAVPYRAPENHSGTSLDQALAELRSFRGRYAGTRELAGVFLEIERVTNPAKIGYSAIADAARVALILENRGVDRRTAAERAATAFCLRTIEVVEAVRKAG